MICHFNEMYYVTLNWITTQRIKGPQSRLDKSLADALIEEALSTQSFWNIWRNVLVLDRHDTFNFVMLKGNWK